MKGKKLKQVYQFDVRCPCCKRKLMRINLSTLKKLKVSLFKQEDSEVHNTETRCHICKSYVAIDILK